MNPPHCNQLGIHSSISLQDGVCRTLSFYSTFVPRWPLLRCSALIFFLLKTRGNAASIGILTPEENKNAAKFKKHRINKGGL